MKSGSRATVGFLLVLANTNASWAGGSGMASAAGMGISAVAMTGAMTNGFQSMSMSAPCAKENMMACMIAAQALMQALSLMGNSSGAASSGDSLAGDGISSGGYGTTPTTGTDLSGLYDGATTGTTGSSLTPSQVAAQLAAAQAALAATGTSISGDNKTITLPDGRQVSSGTGSSSGDLASAGFSPAEIDAGNAALKASQAAMADKIQTMKIAGSADSGGGGGGGGAGRAGDGGGTDYNALFGKLRGANANFKKGNVAGMSKKLGTDNIGVAGDDIFEMISRRYKARDGANAFIK